MDKKSDNFKRLAENRTNKLIGILELIGNLSNKSNYSYTEEQVNKIFETIEEEVRTQKNKFKFVESEQKKKFRL